MNTFFIVHRWSAGVVKASIKIVYHIFGVQNIAQIAPKTSIYVHDTYLRLRRAVGFTRYALHPLDPMAMISVKE